MGVVSCFDCSSYLALVLVAPYLDCFGWHVMLIVFHGVDGLYFQLASARGEVSYGLIP